MERSIWIFDIKISRIDTGIVIIRVSLSKSSCTGIWVILSPEGAERTRASAKESTNTLIMVIYLF